MFISLEVSSFSSKIIVPEDKEKREREREKKKKKKEEKKLHMYVNTSQILIFYV